MKTPSVLLLVCESGNRWLDTVRRFVFADAQSVVVTTQACELNRVRARISNEPFAVVLWEVAESNAADVGLAIAQIAVGRPDVLQLVALDRSTVAAAPSMRVRLQELSAAAVIDSPEQFPMLTRMIHRHLERAR